MRSERRVPPGSRRRALHAFALAAAGSAVVAGLPGCLMLPLPEHGLNSGKGAVHPQTLEEFRVGRATRADVLLRLGEPSERRWSDRVFVYGWEAEWGYAFVTWYYGGTAAPLPTEKYAAIHFDDAGIVDDAVLLEYWFHHPGSHAVDEWAGPDAPRPAPSSDPPAETPQGVGR
jgi:outer membrane protein assembly factor BamE (lipoprotein component of BamABCDE complex)